MQRIRSSLSAVMHAAATVVWGQSTTDSITTHGPVVLTSGATEFGIRTGDERGGGKLCYGDAATGEQGDPVCYKRE